MKGCDNIGVEAIEDDAQDHKGYDPNEGLVYDEFTSTWIDPNATFKPKAVVINTAF